jgi:hypothetical protein
MAYWAGPLTACPFNVLLCTSSWRADAAGDGSVQLSASASGNGAIHAEVGALLRD